ncbi:hypothetical protein PSTT_07384, partial [Puccinia striiformis]
LADLEIVCDQLPFIKPGPSDPNTDPNSQLFKPLNSYINPPGTSPANPGLTIEETPAQNSVNDIGDTLSTPSAPSPVYSSCPLPALLRGSFPIGCTAEACPNKYNIADMKAITINEYSDTSMDVLGSITIVKHSDT